MNKHTIMTILWFFTGVLCLIAFLVLDNGAQIMALFCAFQFLFVGFYRQYKKR